LTKGKTGAILETIKKQTETKEQIMTTVKDLIDALSKMPADAHVILRGSDETYDGYSHPFVELDSDGEVVIREADEPEYDGQPSEHDEWMSFDPDC
jgi:type IV secretory pathway TrbF-like protein